MAYDAFPARWNDGDKQAAYDKLQGIANRAHDNYNAERRVTAELRAELDKLRARAQRIEAALVLTEDQRDKTLKERDALREQLNDLQAGMKQWEDGHASAVARVIAERDAMRKQLDELRSDYADKSYWGKE